MAIRLTWDVSIIALVNCCLLTLTLALSYWRYRSLYWLIFNGIVQVKLGKAHAEQAVDISLRTDNRLATGTAVADNAAAVVGRDEIQKKLDEVLTLLPGKVAEEVRSQAASDSGHSMPSVVNVTTDNVTVTTTHP